MLYPVIPRPLQSTMSTVKRSLIVQLQVTATVQLNSSHHRISMISSPVPPALNSHHPNNPGKKRKGMRCGATRHRKKFHRPRLGRCRLQIFTLISLEFSGFMTISSVLSRCRDIYKLPAETIWDIVTNGIDCLIGQCSGIGSSPEISRWTGQSALTRQRQGYCSADCWPMLTERSVTSRGCWTPVSVLVLL